LICLIIIQKLPKTDDKKRILKKYKYIASNENGVSPFETAPIHASATSQSFCLLPQQAFFIHLQEIPQ
jgi:isopentenyldiphosphate isomerase